MAEVTRPTFRVFIDWLWKEDPLILDLKFDESYGVEPDQQGYTLFLFDRSKFESGYDAISLIPSKGRFGQGFFFDGLDSRIPLGSDARFNLTGDFTIEMRILFYSLPPEHDLLLFGSSTFQLRIPWSEGRLELAIFDGETWRILRMSGYPEPERFNHFFVIRRKTEGKLQFWLNGVLDSEFDLPSWVEILFPEGDEFFVGGSNQTDAFDGLMDEFRIYNIALNDALISERSGGSKDVRSISVSRGKSQELGGKFVAGAVNLDLIDPDGRYSPFNESSPLYPYLKLNKPIFIEAEYDGIFFPIFSGYIDRIIPHPALGQRRVAISGRDRFKDLIGRKISLGPFSNYAYEDLIREILSASDWKTHEFEIEDLGAVASFAAWRDQTPLSCLEDIAAAGIFVHYIDPEGRYKFRNMSFFYPFILKEIFEFESFDLEYSDEGVINHARVESQPRELRPAELVWKLAEPFELNPGEIKIIEGEYHDYTTGGRRYASNPTINSFAAEDEYGNPLTNIAVTIDAVKASSVLLRVENNEEIKARITSIEVYGQPFIVLPRIVAEREDPTSVQLFFRKTFSLSSDLISNEYQASLISDFAVMRNKDPASRLSISLKDNFPLMLFLDLGSGLKVKEAFLSIEDFYQVESLSLKVNPTTSILDLELKKTSPWQVFILDSSYLGEGLLL